MVIRISRGKEKYKGKLPIIDLHAKKFLILQQDILIEMKKRKGNIPSTKEGEAKETTKVTKIIETTRIKVRNHFTLLKKMVLIVTLMIMMKKFLY